MVLDRLSAEDPAISQGALLDSREPLVAHDMDRWLLERTAAIARSTKGLDAKKPKSGREHFRERVPVEDRLAHIGQRQGPQAPYLGARRNLNDLPRADLIQNLETVPRKAA